MKLLFGQTVHFPWKNIFQSQFSLEVCEVSKMSFKILQENLLKSKVFDLDYMRKQLDMKHKFVLDDDEGFPKKLRESLKSETTNYKLNEFQEELSAVVNTRKEEAGDQTNVDTAEVARDCPSHCSYKSCLNQGPSCHSDIFIAPKFSSSVSVIHSEISLKALELPAFDPKSFMTITRIVPLRNHSVIIHWHVKTTHGIRGYQIFLDGNLASSIYSSERTIALIKNVNMSVSHDFSIFIVPDKSLLQNIMEPLMKPVTYFYKPKPV